MAYVYIYLDPRKNPEEPIYIGSKRSEETRLLMSKQRKGKKQTPAQYKANCNRKLETKK